MYKKEQAQYVNSKYHAKMLILWATYSMTMVDCNFKNSEKVNMPHSIGKLLSKCCFGNKISLKGLTLHGFVFDIKYFFQSDWVVTRHACFNYKTEATCNQI
jgi:hypothetical protein